MEKVLMVMKNEERSKRDSSYVVDGEISEGVHVKHRRRDSAISISGNTGQITQENDPTSTLTTMKRSSRYRGVSRHKWTGRYEAHLWDRLSWNVTRKRNGKQVYLGAYDDEETAARAYDLASIKYWGITTFTNFQTTDYEEEIEIMHTVTKEEYLASLRRKSSGFSRGVSKYRGVARHHHNGRWEARIGRVFGNKYLYLGTYSSQEEAARAYDIAAIEYRGINAITNFDSSTYIRRLKTAVNDSVPLQGRKSCTKSTEILPCLSLSNNLQLSCLSIKAVQTNYPTKQETCKSKFSYNNCRQSSSPTALDLLLKSSLFRELVRKNSNLLQEKTGNYSTMAWQQANDSEKYELCDIHDLLPTKWL